jgi:hypothetical protein
VNNPEGGCLKRIVFLCLFLVLAGCDDETPWRSQLYPQDWAPGYTDTEGRFLHDFSYAGYHRGERQLPDLSTVDSVDVTKHPYHADPTGQTDTTMQIQAAIDDVAAQGGGVVFLPQGEYRVRPQGEGRAALYIDKDNVVLKGAGRGKTKIYNDQTEMRFKDVIRVSPRREHDYNWLWHQETITKITQDISEPTKKILVEDLEGLRVGQWIFVRSRATDAFIAEHGMQGVWTEDKLVGQVYLREIQAIERDRKVIIVDIPIRYRVLVRDEARISKVPRLLKQVGLEDFSIGMKDVRRKELDRHEYNSPGTKAYKVHQAHAVKFNHTVNSWIRRVSTYKPKDNRKDFHVLSMGLNLVSVRSITVDNCMFHKSVYQGHGGNGHMFAIGGSDNLIKDSVASKGRHNFQIYGLVATGNVIFRSASVQSKEPSDFHMHLSPANLIDNLTLKRDHYSALFRDSHDHGHGTTQSVFWNIHSNGIDSLQGLSWHAIETAQFGHGYVIGTSGRASSVKAEKDDRTVPIDWVEGAKKGKGLKPQSLYLDQLERRMAK